MHHVSLARHSVRAVFVGLCALAAQAQAQCVATFPYVEDFESGPGGWTSGVISGVANTWGLGTPNLSVINTAGSGSASWHTGNSPSGKYENNERSFVKSPCFDFSGLTNPSINLLTNWHSQYIFDYATLEYSLNGGGTWTRIGVKGDPYNWYNAQNGTGSVQGWSGTATYASNGWLSSQHDLSFLGGEASVELRIAFRADGTSNFNGFAFDKVTIAELCPVNIGDDIVACYGDANVLSVAGCVGAQVLWDTPSSLTTGSTALQIPITLPGFYSVYVTDALGFQQADTVSVAVSQLNANLGPDVILCPGDAVTLNQGVPLPGSTFQWYAGISPSVATTTNQTITVTQPGFYWLEAQDNLGCIRRDTVQFAVENVPVVYLGADTSICVGESIVLDAGAGPIGTTYQWFNSGVPGAQTQATFVSSPGTYRVNLITPGGCLATDTIGITVISAPVVSLGINRPFCVPEQLDAGNPLATQHLWSTGDTTQAITVLPVLGGGPQTVWVQVTAGTGCITTDTVVLTPTAPPAIELGTDRVLCEGQPFVLNAGAGGSSYLWNTGANTQTIVVGEPGLYAVTVSDAAGCTVSDAVNVSLSVVGLDLGADTTLCQGDPIVLDGTIASPASYGWNNGKTTPSIVVTTGGTYILTVTNTEGCTERDTVVVVQQPAFNADFSAPDTVRLYDPVAFSDGSSPSAVYWEWHFGNNDFSLAQNPTHSFVAVGTYAVTLIASNGLCYDTLTQPVVVVLPLDMAGPLDAAPLHIAPNPSNGAFEVTFDLPAAAPVSLRLMDLRGQALHAADLPAAHRHHARIEANLPAGLYLLRIEAAGSLRHAKVWVR